MINIINIIIIIIILVDSMSENSHFFCMTLDRKGHKFPRATCVMCSDCQLDLGTDFLVGNMVFVWDV